MAVLPYHAQTIVTKQETRWPIVTSFRPRIQVIVPSLPANVSNMLNEGFAPEFRRSGDGD